jgi:hypothetical protein
MRDWIGDASDPQAFSVDQVNPLLAPRAIGETPRS